MDLLKTQRRTSGSTGRTTPRRCRRSSPAHGGRHHVAGHRQPHPGRQEGPGQGDRAQGGLDRLVGHLDGVVKAKHPNCSYKWMDWIVSPTVNAQVAQWFGEAPAQPRPARSPGEGALRDLPRRGQGLLRQHLVLDHADQACLDGRGTSCRLREVDAGLDRDQGLGGDDPRGLVTAATARSPAGGGGGRTPPPGCCPGTRGCGWAPCSRARAVARGGLPRLARGHVRHRVLDHRHLHRRRGPHVTLENFQTLLGDPVYRTIALRTVGVASAVTVSTPSSRCRSPSTWPRWRGRGRGGDGRGDPHPAVGQLPGQGVRVAGDARGERRDQLGAAPAGPAAGPDTACWQRC